MFKLWSGNNSRAKEILHPDLSLRSWNVLSPDEKYKIWKYLEEYFFDRGICNTYENNYERILKYFFGSNQEKQQKSGRIFLSIVRLNEGYKMQSYAKNFLEKKSYVNAATDFYNIFMDEDENVVFELISFYCLHLISERKNEKPRLRESEDDGAFEARTEEWRWDVFDQLAKDLNEVFNQFAVNVCLTRQGFIPRQDERIVKEIYEPTLKCLSDEKWKVVNRHLSDGFKEYHVKTPQGYSNCVTNIVSAVQAFLQIIVNGETGKGDISKLILDAQRNNLIPDDFFTKKIFENIESIFAKERQETGIAHPTEDYANEKNARMLLNLAMIFLQHCLQGVPEKFNK